MLKILPATALFLIAFATYPNLAQPAGSAEREAAKLRPLGNGVEASEAGVTMRVTALRDDVLRVRMWRDGAAAMPVPSGDPDTSDASWAVLPAARTASVKVTAEADGFRTGALRLAVGKGLMLTLSDLEGGAPEGR